MQWRVLITLAGVDKSSQLVGEVIIDAEESAAAIAEFTLLPEPGAINPDQWIGAPILIDAVVDGGAPERIFTGNVDVPKYDVQSGLTKFRCTDGLQKRLEEMSRDEINQIVFSYWSPYVFDDTSDGWEYAQDYVSTQYVSLEANRYGAISANSLRNVFFPGLVVGDSDYIDGSLEVDLPSHRDLINRVDLQIECRYTMYVEATGNAGWAWPYKPGEAPGWPVPSPSAAQSAASSIGTLASFAYQAFPETGLYKIGSWTTASSVDIASGSFVSWRNDRPAESCFSFSAKAAKRAPVEVTYKLSQEILFPDSVNRFGESTRSEVFSLDLTEQPPAGWEQFQAEVSSPASFAQNEWLRPDVPVSFDPALYEDVIDVLTRFHQVDIYKRHRARVRFDIPFLARVDRSFGVMLNSTLVTATGKVYRYLHRLNTNTGQAVTELTLAPNISGVSESYRISGRYAELPDELPVKPDTFDVSVSFDSRDPAEPGNVGFHIDAAAPDFSPIVFEFPSVAGDPEKCTAFLHAAGDAFVIHGRSA